MKWNPAASSVQELAKKLAIILNKNIGTDNLTDGSVTKEIINSDIVGSGLSLHTDKTLKVNVDGTTIEIINNVLTAKDIAIGADFFDTPGVHDFVIPDGITRVWVTLSGGGGGGGTYGGGGADAKIKQRVDDLTPGAVITVTVGAGGGTAAAGGASSFGVHVSASGGGGGNVNGNAGGLGGTSGTTTGGGGSTFGSPFVGSNGNGGNYGGGAGRTSGTGGSGFVLVEW